MNMRMCVYVQTVSYKCTKTNANRKVYVCVCKSVHVCVCVLTDF